MIHHMTLHMHLVMQYSLAPGSEIKAALGIEDNTQRAPYVLRFRVQRQGFQVASGSLFKHLLIAAV